MNNILNLFESEKVHLRIREFQVSIQQIKLRKIVKKTYYAVEWKAPENNFWTLIDNVKTVKESMKIMKRAINAADHLKFSTHEQY